MKRIWATLICTLLAPTFGHAAENRDLKQVDRRIAKEPAYLAKRPLYGLLVQGPQVERRIWMVLDHSKPDAGLYDLLYVDLNADGDLTDRAERILGQVQGTEVRFQLPDLADPKGGDAHTRFTVRVSGGLTPTVMVSLGWRNRFKMGGGYPQDPEAGYLRFGESPSTAPVVWADGDGPFRFQRWYSGVLTIGGSDDFKVFVGQPGSGPSSFWAFQEHFLPEAEGVQATLIYWDSEDKERRVICLLKERC